MHLQKPSQPALSSLTNPRVKNVVRLRQRSHRDEAQLMLIEGYREIRRALNNRYKPQTVFYCEELFLKNLNEFELIEQCRTVGAEIVPCTAPVFQKMAYRERPDGLLAVGPQLKSSLSDLNLPEPALVIVVEAIEKPGNLGTILRTADASGVHAVIVCDRCTDINNPNVVRASTGMLFALPVIETRDMDALNFLQSKNFSILAATPHTRKLHTETDLTGNVAIVLGTEQYGLSNHWLDAANLHVRIPMFGQADSLNVAAAATILLYEAVRQRLAAGITKIPPPSPD